MFKKQADEGSSNKKKQKSAPRGSKQGWSYQEDLYINQNEQAIAVKQKKKLAVQNFIENAKKNKFSDWRKSKNGIPDNSEAS